MERIGFVINVYKDEQLAVRLVNRIKDLHPTAPITLVFDGEESFSLPGVTTLAGERLKLASTGVLWVLRYLQAGYDMDCEYVIKMDPDSYLVNRISFIPKGDIAGAPCEYPGTTTASGGVFCITREAIGKILSIKDYLMKLRKYSNLGGYYRYTDYRHPWEAETADKIAIEELIITDFMVKCGLVFTEWPGIVNRFRPPYETLEGHNRTIAIHPYIGDDTCRI